MDASQRSRALRLVYELETGRTSNTTEVAYLLRELAAEPVRQWLGPYTDAWTALNELRRAVAEVIGADPDVWPTHGNAPLAIAASVATRQMELEKRDAASAEPVRVPMTWQPIETAPKGRIVLVYYTNDCGRGRTMRARYYLPETLESEVNESGWCDEGWYEESEAYEYLMPLEHDPTHWMPLPDAPHGITLDAK